METKPQIPQKNYKIGSEFYNYNSGNDEEKSDNTKYYIILFVIFIAAYALFSNYYFV